MLDGFQRNIIFLYKMLRNIQILNFLKFDEWNPCWCKKKNRHDAANIHTFVIVITRPKLYAF